MQGKARAVGLVERHTLAALQLGPDDVGQDGGQRIAGKQVAGQPGADSQRQAQVHHLLTDAVVLRHKMAGGIGWPAKTPGFGTGQRHVLLQAFAADPRKDRGAKRRIGKRQCGQRCVAPLDPQQLAPAVQQSQGLRSPVANALTGALKRLQVLDVAAQRGAHIADRFGCIAFYPHLHLAGFVQPGQPHQRDEHGHNQQHQHAPQGAASPKQRKAPDQALGNQAHSRRCSSAGSCARHCAIRVRSSSAITTPGPCAISASTWPQGSIARLWPQVRLPFSCRPPWAGAST